MSVEANVQKMIDDLTAALADAVQHDKGNSAAGTRVRKAMQEVKANAQGIRVQVQNDKNN
ncbi:MAG: histone H1 [Euryarchaeota archaeon]|nr:histone H1 [Euryarchaeota archaeon]